MKIDVVYVLGSGSKWEDNEIRFSMRSFHKHFKDLGKIVVVGQFPRFADPDKILHIPYKDDIALHKDARMIKKLIAACKHPDVSRNFIFATDDEILLRDMVWEEFCANYEGTISDDIDADSLDHYKVANPTPIPRRTTWFGYLIETRNYLRDHGHTWLNFDKSHCPEPIDKINFLDVIREVDYEKNHFTCSNIYQNIANRFPTLDVSDLVLKVYHPFDDPNHLLELLGDKQYLNFSDHGLNYSMIQVLQYLFPEMSPYELYDMKENKLNVIIDWLDDPADYEQGYALYVKFGVNTSLKRRFAKGETSYNREKLVYELGKLVKHISGKRLVVPKSPSKQEKSKKEITRTKAETVRLLKLSWEELSAQEKEYFHSDESFFSTKQELYDNVSELHAHMKLLHRQLNDLSKDDSKVEERKECLSKLEPVEQAHSDTWSMIDNFEKPESKEEKPTVTDEKNDAVEKALERERLIKNIKTNISRTKSKLKKDPEHKNASLWEAKLQSLEKELSDLEKE
jgi:hypothetical protein